ncbi:auxin efflux carrier superfamily [Xylariaceae sp. FL0255]|nr:auxin efflux carrier superfamily [Xylariaceae sp. FL0255]
MEVSRNSPYSTLFRASNTAGPEWGFDDMSPTLITMAGHDKHPSLAGLALLVFEAVLEVVCVSLPGYVLAKRGLFKPEHQKFAANLNMWLFTPCLIFSKLASKLNPSQLGDLAVIPVIFILQTCVSYTVSICVSKLFRFGKRPTNFVTAMSVFGNSNSVPISLVISLSQTLKNLSWDRIQGDHSGLVSSRGILYLLIFQQLGQMLRWSWGFHVLLAKKEEYEEYQDERTEEGRYRDENVSGDSLIADLDGSTDGDVASIDFETSDDEHSFSPAGPTPVVGTSRTSTVDSDDDAGSPRKRPAKIHGGDFDGANGRFVLPAQDLEHILSFPRVHDLSEPEIPDGPRGLYVRSKIAFAKACRNAKRKVASSCYRGYVKLPIWIRVPVEKAANFLVDFMNPPLWAMIISVLVAAVPALQRLFFQDGFVKNSVTRAITQSGGVAVPLILVVLGANLANSTKDSEKKDAEEAQIGTRLLVASLVSRMVFPTLIMAPLLALIAKHTPISILDDPIFIVVCFLLAGAPSALQLAQICQINEVYEGVMSKILFQSYVVWILPSTLILVMLALETLEWAGL